MQKFTKISTITILLLCFLSLSSYTQAEQPRFQRKGFSFGFAIGCGSVTLNQNNLDNSLTQFSLSLPNIKIGYAFSDRLAIFATLPGATYQEQGLTRGFEGVLFTTQYWLIDHWWVSGGVGLTFDAPAFYTVENFEEAKFYGGAPSVSLGTGYEIYRRKRFSIDLQYRIFYGQVELMNDNMKSGVSNMVMFGFNWY